MKTVILSCLLILITFEGITQYNPRPSRSRFFQSRFSTFTVKPGDMLVYNITKDSVQYNLVVTVKSFGDEIRVNYLVPDKFSRDIEMPSSAVKYALKYNAILDTSAQNPHEKGFLWLSKKNYSDLDLAKETMLDFGNGNETFVRKNTGTFKINYKGKEQIFTMYDVENTGETKIGFSVLNEENNPLIVKMNNGWSITLKEIR